MSDSHESVSDPYLGCWVNCECVFGTFPVLAPKVSSRSPLVIGVEYMSTSLRCRPHCTEVSHFLPR